MKVWTRFLNGLPSSKPVKPATGFDRPDLSATSTDGTAPMPAEVPAADQHQETAPDPIPHTESHSYPSYAQSGEDRIIFALFQSLRSDYQLRYADIGAGVPAGHNNTYLFYTLGGSGVLAEPDAAYVPAYRLLRPRDAFETVAIVPKHLNQTGTITFYAMHDQGWSTVLDEHRATAERLGKGGVREQVTVRCMTIGQLLEKHFPDGNLDFLSLDIEGLDTDVLAELDLQRFRPKAIVFEDPNGMVDAAVVSPHRTNLEAAGYAPYAFTGANMIYVDRAVLRSARF